MYINQPIIKAKGNKKIGDNSKPALPKPDTNKPQETSNGEAEFQNIISGDLDNLMKQWQDSLSIIEKTLSHYREVKQSESQKIAFDHCLYLLAKQFDKQESAYACTANLFAKKILQIDDYKLRIKKQIGKLREECRQLMEEQNRVHEGSEEMCKKKSSKQSYRRKIEEEEERILKMKKQIGDCKQSSHDQKSEFIELQGEEFRMERELAEIDEQQRKQQEDIRLANEYHKLKEMKQQLIQITGNMEQQIRPHLERKINKISRLRSYLKQLDTGIEECLIKIEDQTFIISALKQKAHSCSTAQEAIENEQSLFALYRKRYSELYLTEEGTSENWKDYKTYLKYLTDRSRQQNSRIRTQFRHESQKMEKMAEGRRATESRRETKQKFYLNNTNKNIQRVKTEATEQTKLPKLLKCQNKKDKPRSKQENKKGKMQSQFDIQSEKGESSDVSGSIIEVEFHRR